MQTNSQMHRWTRALIIFVEFTAQAFWVTYKSINVWICSMFLYIFMLNNAVIKLANTTLIYLMACDWCRFDRFIFCGGLSLAFCDGSVMLLWAVSRCELICQDRDAFLMDCIYWPDLLLCFSLFFPLCSLAIQAMFLQVHPTVFPYSPPFMSASHFASPPSCLVFTLILLSSFSFCHVFLFSVPNFPSFSSCHLPPHAFLPPSLRHCLILPSSPRWNKACPRRNMINMLNFTGYQE